MYYWKMFLWEYDAEEKKIKKTEYSRYMDAPLFLEDKLDETLDSGEVILTGMPIATKSAFPPKTKFRLERYLTANFSDEPRHWDMIVEHDDVEEYAGCPELCTHRVYLIEASAVAQGMHVDNIALTYKLQDVTLNYKTVVSKTDTLYDFLNHKDIFDIGNNGYSKTPTHEEPRIEIPRDEQSHTYYFVNTYNYMWDTTGSEEEKLSGLQDLLYEQDGREAHTIAFKIPSLNAQGCYETGKWENLTEMAIKTKIVRKLCNKDGSVVNEETVDERTCGPKSFGEHLDKVWGIAKKQSIIVDGAPIPDARYVARGTTIQDYGNTDSGFIVSIKKQFSDLYSADNSGVEITEENPDAQSREVTITTPIMTEEQLEAKMYYEYEITCKPIVASGALPIYYSRACLVLDNSYGLHQTMTTEQVDTIKPNTLYVNARFRIGDLSQSVDGDKFLASGKQYTCLELLRKALLTCDTHVFDNNLVGLDTLEYPIIIDPFWEKRLGNVKMHETTFEQKNLWEALIQIGYYLHAIPYLEFADDGTDRFVLRFHQLGDTEIRKEDTSAKITVFNSRNLSEYFSQYDSYVTNLFSPQSEVEEWGVVKTSDSSYLVSNNTAEIHTKYPIQEIVEFDISYGNSTQSALNMIFEESIYSILSPDRAVRPSKACALFYKLGDTKISGLNYEPPSANNDAPYALKTILSALFGVNPKSKLQFNAIRYRIKYRTQDSLRLSQVRPNLQDFMKNSSYEVYPHHEQFYGQQDKIIDSERFSANLFGKLIRVGNAVYQRQEYVRVVGDEKESGDLVKIGGEAYYVTATENEYYPDVILQKVTYSRNFNQLSNIVTIPSEPRFYEVSERSQVRREVRIMEFLLLTTKENAAATNPAFMNSSKWRSIIRSLLFADGSYDMPNFAFVRFKGDKKRTHEGIALNKLFPSTEISRAGGNVVRPKGSSDHRDIIVPLMHFPLKNAIVFEWDMDDNFKAGDSIDTSISGTGDKDDDDDDYYSMQPVRYCDIMGRADLVNFRLFRKTNWTLAQARRLPFAENIGFVPTETASDFYLPDSLSIGLDKDNREALSFNYQINLLQENETFVTYTNLFGAKGSRLQMCFLNVEASLFDDGVSLTARTIIADNVSYSLLDSSKNAIEIRITRPQNINADAVRSIVLYEKDGASKYAYIARNVSKMANDRKFDSWYIYPVFTR